MKEPSSTSNSTEPYIIIRENIPPLSQENAYKHSEIGESDEEYYDEEEEYEEDKILTFADIINS